MTSTKELTLAEFNMREDSLESILSPNRSNYKLSSSVSKPSQASIDGFLCSSSYVSSSERSSREVYSKHDINWTSLEDYLANWDKLSLDDQESLKALVESDLYSNANRFGLKKLNLESHLLLSLGCDMTNIVNNGKDAVSSNLLSKDSLNYSSSCLDNRAVDAKTCLRASRKFEKEHSVEALFKSGLVAYQCVISPEGTFQKPDRESYQEFFRTNASVFAGWSKRRKILSYVYSHEVSVDSILSQIYRPHTHLIFWIEKGKSEELQKHHVQSLEEEFNSLFTDRSLSYTLSETSLGYAPRESKTLKDISRSIGYLHRCYSLADQYTREVRSTNIQELNRKTVETYHTLIELFRSDSSKGGVRRFKGSHIPGKDELESFKHPLLQKKTKISRIEKTKSSQRKASKACKVTTESTIDEPKISKSSRASSKDTKGSTGESILLSGCSTSESRGNEQPSGSDKSSCSKCWSSGGSSESSKGSKPLPPRQRIQQGRERKEICSGAQKRSGSRRRVEQPGWKSGTSASGESARKELFSRGAERLQQKDTSRLRGSKETAGCSES